MNAGGDIETIYNVTHYRPQPAATSSIDRHHEISPWAL
jgi:hypothetical protein